MILLMHIFRLAVAALSDGLLLLCLIWTGYLFIITVAGFLNRNGKARSNANPSSSFAVLIPAHNEELLIGATVQSVLGINYPRALYRVFVIADNSDDSTAARAAEAGAEIIERFDSVNRGKGHALVTGLKHIFEVWSEVDAVVIVDADTQVDPEFLSAMEQSLARGESAIQGVYLGSNAGDSWRTQLQQLAWSLFNYLRPLGRTSMGFSASLLGNGMCFSAELLQRQPWRAFSITEDIEYGIQLLLRGERVTFNAGARVYGQMARTAAQAKSQRLRWEQGRLSILRQFARPLLKATFGQGNSLAAEMLLDMLTPPLAIIVCLNLLSIGLAAFISLDVLLLSFVPLVLLMLSVALGFFAVGPSWRLLRSIVYAPVYIGWKLLLYAVGSLRPARKPEWVRTGRH